MQAISFILWDLGEVMQFPFETVLLRRLAERAGTDFESLWALRRWSELILGKITEREYLAVYEDALSLGIEELQELYDFYFDRAIEGSIALVKELTYLEQGILSNHYGRAWSWLEQHEVLEVIPRCNVFLSCDIGVAKPDTIAYQTVLKRLGRIGTQILYIDNMERNLGPARALGMHTIKFEKPEQLRKDLQSMGIIKT